MVLAPRVQVMFGTVGALHVECNLINGEAGGGVGFHVHNMRLNTADWALALYGVTVRIGIATHSLCGCDPQRSLPNSSGYRNKNKICFGVWALARSRQWGSASFRRGDAAQVCSNAVFVVVDGDFECSVAIAAWKIVSERW